jgi:hypothetical protein
MNSESYPNILVTQESEKPQIYLIDCPAGQRWIGALRHYRLLKDIACLDKLAKQQLRRTQRMRFFLDYRNNVPMTGNEPKGGYRRNLHRNKLTTGLQGYL